MLMPATVSVIVATRDRPSLLREALASLERQTFRDFEVLVVDDASEDRDGVERVIPRDPRFRLIRLERSAGPGGARNIGFELAKGDLLAVLDDDDVAVETRLARQVEALEAEASAGLVFSAVQWFRGEMQPTGVFPGVVANGRWPREAKDVFRLLYLESNKIPNTTVMFRRSALGKLRYPEWTRIGEDCFLFMQLAALGLRTAAIRDCLVWQRRDSAWRSLVQNREERCACELMVLKRVRGWLAEEGICTFDGLHKRALSHALARQGLMVSGWKG